MLSFLDKAKKELKKMHLDAFIFKLSNEHLYEFVSKRENSLIELCGFTGDTGEFLLLKDKGYLLVDGRFTIQAKNEVKDKNVKVINIDKYSSNLSFYRKILRKGFKLGIDANLISVANFYKLKDMASKMNIEIIDMPSFMAKDFNEAKKNLFYMSSAPLFMLDKKYVSKTPKEKIDDALKYIKTSLDANNGVSADNALKFGYSTFNFPEKFNTNDITYVTSSLEEVAFITNLRYEFADIDNHGPLFNSFLILNKTKSILYIDDYIKDKYLDIIAKNGIMIKKCKCFYKDLKKIKNKKYCYIDSSIINYHIFKTLGIKKENFIISPFHNLMSIKGKTEIRNLRKCNVIDGVAITKAIYNIKTYKNYKTEYDIKLLVDKMRKDVGKDLFLCNSFDTIVAYKENSAICHYTPTKENAKVIRGDGLLLIDSGGDYMLGTTDITRTISLYKNKNKISPKMKKHYTLVLNAMLSLAMQKFPYGLTGSELDIVAREKLYNEYLDFSHGTGHGIGYISNVHEGQNRIGPGIKKYYIKNIIEEGQVQSDEPGLYFEGKYGIRLENDLLCVKARDNVYGTFLGFEMLTLCPFEKDLIDKKYLEPKVLPFLEKYNRLVYKTLSRYLDKKEKAWLKEQICL